MRPKEPQNSDLSPVDWEVLLDGSDRDKALVAIEDIAQALISPPPAWIPDFDAEPFRISRGISLGTGSPALALFYAYHAQSLNSGSSYAEQLAKYLEYTGGGLEVARLEPMFMLGLPGVLWALDHIATLTGAPLAGLDEAMVEADSFLEGHTIDEEGLDLWFGLVGHGIYALPRVAEPSARHLLASILDGLLSAFDSNPAAPPWIIRPQLLKKPDRAGTMIPHTQFGVAHGIAGVIAFLAEAHRCGLGDGKIPAICDRAWRWLDAQKSKDDQGPFWPNAMGPGIPVKRGINKWCSGMPGIAAALLAASQKLGHNEMKEWSISRAREMSEYTREFDLPQDVSLCHGSASLGHMFNRIFQQTGDELFADTARFFMKLTLELQTPGHGVGGFFAYGKTIFGDTGEMFDPGLMVGSSGVGLTLLAAVSNQAPHWDQALLLS